MSQETAPTPTEQLKAPETVPLSIEGLTEAHARELKRKQQYAEQMIGSSPLSQERKKSFLERISVVSEEYSSCLAKIKYTALLAVALNAASPAFAQDEERERVDAPPAATYAMPGTHHELSDADLMETPPQSIDASDEHVPEQSVTTPPDSHTSPPEMVRPENPEAASAVVAIVEQAVKEKIKDAQDNPVEAGIELASKFGKGPIKHLSNILELGKAIKESVEKKENLSDIAIKLGRLVLDAKTLGLGSVVLDMLKNAPTAPQNAALPEERIYN